MAAEMMTKEVSKPNVKAEYPISADVGDPSSTVRDLKKPNFPPLPFSSHPFRSSELVTRKNAGTTDKKKLKRRTKKKLSAITVSTVNMPPEDVTSIMTAILDLLS